MDILSAHEKRLWNAARKLCTNSALASSEYRMPGLGLIFAGHANNRHFAVKPEIEAHLSQRGRVKRLLAA